MELDDVDRRILDVLVKNPKASYREIARTLDLHPVTVIKRVKKMKVGGFLKGFCVRINLKNLGYEVSALLFLKVDYKNKDKLLKTLLSKPYIVNGYEITGDYNFVFHVSVKNTEELHNVMEEIVALDGVKEIKSNVVLKSLKEFCFEGPFDYAIGGVVKKGVKNGR